jgi:hypothetical protein
MTAPIVWAQRTDSVYFSCVSAVGLHTTNRVTGGLLRGAHLSSSLAFHPLPPHTRRINLPDVKDEKIELTETGLVFT